MNSRRLIYYWDKILSFDFPFNLNQNIRNLHFSHLEMVKVGSDDKIKDSPKFLCHLCFVTEDTISILPDDDELCDGC